MGPDKFPGFSSSLDALNEFKFDFSLKRVKKALRLNNSPQNSFLAVHITGSNGKGSCANFLSNIFMAHGLKTGTYTSPHLLTPEERIAVNGEKTGRRLFAGEGEKLFKLLDKNKIWLTYFEFLTVLAFIIFRKEKVRVAVIEVGLGGRYDATNVAYAHKLLSVITSISLEHTDYLGDTEMKILREKEQIIGGGDAVVNITGPALKAYLKRKYGHRVYFSGETYPVLRVKARRSWLEAEFKPGVFRTRMIETVQAQNISTVLTALKALETQGFKFNSAKVRKAIYDTVLTGRMSLSKKGYYLSVAHNPAAFKEALDTLKVLFPGRKVVYIFSALKDKDVNSMFKTAAGYKNIDFILTEIENPRAISIGKLKEYVVKYGIKHMVEVNNKKAFLLAKKIKGKGIIVVGGSFYLVNKFL